MTRKSGPVWIAAIGVVALCPIAPSAAEASLAPDSAICFSPPTVGNELLIANLTPVGADRPGWGRLVDAGGRAGATTSNVNFAPGSVDPNVALATNRSGSTLCYQAGGPGRSDVIIDLVGSIGAGIVVGYGRAPSRTVDTRESLGGARLAAGERRCFPVYGEPGQLAIMNLTPVGAVRPGHGQLMSSDTQGRPNASNVNFGPGSVDPNIAAAVIGSDGQVCFLNSVHGPVDLIADHLATLQPSGFSAAPSGSPTRLVDTRDGLGGTAISPGERRCFAVAVGTPGLMAAVNLTVVDATAPGHGRLEQSGAVPPSLQSDVSHVNFGPGTFDPNVAFARIGDDGMVCFVNSDHATVDLVADQLFAVHGTADSRRLLDTRAAVPSTTMCTTDRTCIGYAPAPSAQSGYAPGSLLWTSDGGVVWNHSEFTLSYPLQFSGFRCDAATSTCYLDGYSPGTGLNPRRDFTLTSVDAGRTWR